MLPNIFRYDGMFVDGKHICFDVWAVVRFGAIKNSSNVESIFKMNFEAIKFHCLIIKKFTIKNP